MKPSFERQLRSMPENGINREEANLLEDVFKGPENAQFPEGVSERVGELQKIKRGNVEKLHERLKLIDKDVSVEVMGKRTHSLFAQEDGTMISRSSEGEEYLVTRGQLLTDGVWGTGYALDSSVKRTLRKEYVLEEARREIKSLLDHQIAIVESELNPDEKEKRSYAAVLGRLEEGGDIFSWDDGHIAEQMVHSLVKKWIIDHDLPLELIAADLFEDVTNKLDFVIKRKKQAVGVAVEADDSPEIGVQFTLMHREDAVEGKRRTITEALQRGMKGEFAVKDIFLVNMHPSYVKRAVNAWKKKKAPGGPDEKLELGAKTDLFEKICGPFLSPSEIEEWKIKIFGQKAATAKKLKTYA